MHYAADVVLRIMFQPPLFIRDQERLLLSFVSVPLNNWRVMGKKSGKILF